MKKVFFSILAITISAIIFVISCKKDNAITNNSNLKTELKTNPYDFIGQIHNQGLNELKIEAKEANKKNEKINLCKFVSNFMMNKICKSNIASSNIQLASNLKNVISKAQCYQSIYLSDSKSDSIDFIIDTLNLTTFQKNEINSILNALNKTKNVKETLLSIESEVLNSNVNDNEKTIVLCVISITKYSYDFWTENNDSKLCVGCAAKADAISAVTAGVSSICSGASTTGLVFGPGGYVLTTAGAAVAGGLWGSGAYLISSWWD